MSSPADLERALAYGRQAALKALQEYDLAWEEIRFHAFSETCTFVITTRQKGTCLLRIHPGMDTKAVEAELACLELWGAGMDVPLPQGMTAPSGERAVSIELEDGHCCSASLMRWVEGAPASGRLTRDQIFREGVLLAKLHKASQDAGLTGHPDRPVWGEDSFREAVSRLDAFHECFLSEAEFELYRAAAERIVSWIGKLEKHSAAYGFVHGDLHQGNIVFDGEEPRAIDFGRCGSGFYLYDIAHTILGLYPAQRELVLHGYESLRPLGAHWLPALEHFTIMVLIENYSHHAPDPRETEGLRAEQPYAQAMLKRFLSERPFLFQSLEG